MKGSIGVKEPVTKENEGNVKADVKKLLDKHQWFHWMPPANGYGKTGISDIHAVKQGMFMVIETKFGRNKATAQQIGFLESVNACEHFAFVVNEKNLSWLKVYLDHLDTMIEYFAKTGKMPAVEQGGPALDAIKALTDPIIDAKRAYAEKIAKAEAAIRLR
jgi:hypothetical protein